MRYLGCILLLLSLLLPGCKPAEKEVERPPNIVLFFVDDLGWQDTSVPFWKAKAPFNERYHTPNMETLAAEGMKFTQAYATAVCSPTRISLITGMNAARHRVTNWTLRKDKLQPMETEHERLSFPNWNVNGIDPGGSDPNAVHATPFPSLLKDAGYHTIHTGKAHFGAIGTVGEDPLNLGFAVNIAGHAAGAPGSYYGLENFGNGQEKRATWAVPGLEAYHGKDINLTEVLTVEALKEVDAAVSKEQPFFLYMAHYTVHTPIMEDHRYFQKYLEKGIDTVEARYASMIEGMDKSLGDIMNYLDSKNLSDDTIILFMSDNGGLSAVARGGELHTHNRPLASGKGSVYEGGIREPMLVKWPGKVSPGSVSNKPLIIEDFFPTILEMGGVTEKDVVQQVDGISFIPELLGETTASTERPLFWHYPNEWGPDGPGVGASSAVRQGDWKFIYFHLDQRMELYNLAEDIGETENRAASEPGKVEELAKILSDHLTSVQAQMPSHKDSGTPIPYPAAALETSSKP
ncbi:MAG: sulfatase [Bacteroidota bacterium]